MTGADDMLSGVESGPFHIGGGPLGVRILKADLDAALVDNARLAGEVARLEIENRILRVLVLDDVGVEW